MSTVIATEELSTEILQNQFRTPLQQEADDSNRPLTDPSASERDPNDNTIPPFVLPSFPDQDPLYPHLIVSEAGDEGARPDDRADLHEHTYDVEVKILAKSTTSLNKRTDEVRGWFEDRIPELNAAGYTDPEIAGGGGVPDYESAPSVKSKTVLFRGTVYTG
jgi:hypothetical protein